MKRIFLSFFIFMVCFSAFAQTSFRTVVPRQPVIAGESFEVQYIVEGESNIETFTAPAFTHFRLVAGPHVYTGSVIDQHIPKPLVNTVYTLVPMKPGRYLLHGAKAFINGAEINSDDVIIEVISREEAFRLHKKKDSALYSGSEYFLHPGENPIEKIRQNLFMKVLVNKRNCYVGEPIVATYKLYSRLESKSDIVKNPGFYGFAVYDMINLEDKMQTTEVLKGKTFDVHTIRKVQLYPLQAGNYVIDPMELLNKVEFSRNEVNKKTEQEIVEGILHNADAEMHTNTEVYENSSRTEPITVLVKALPAKNKTDSFTAAVGDFSITAELDKKEIAKNEQCHLVVSIKGKGNFTQLVPPEVKWPAGIDAFEPVVKDSIDRLKVPLTGTKTFIYVFVSGKAGNYKIPPIDFRYFNPDTGHFENRSTQPQAVRVSNKEFSLENLPILKNKEISPYNLYKWVGIAILVMLGMLAFLIWKNKKIRKKAEQRIEEELNLSGQVISIDKILEVPQMMMVADDNRFYKELNKSIWEYFRQKLQVSGSAMNKPLLVQKLRTAGVDDKTLIDLITIMSQCERVMYTDATPEIQKEDLFTKTKEVLKAIHQQL